MRVIAYASDESKIRVPESEAGTPKTATFSAMGIRT